MKTKAGMPKPSDAQHRILSAASAHKYGRVISGDPRTMRLLIERGWIKVDGHHYGPLFAITDAGRAIVTPAKVDEGQA